MALISTNSDGWSVNRINRGPPFHVEQVGPWKLPQVCDKSGTVALSGPDGAVFCGSVEQAEILCSMANSGELEVL